LDNTTETEYICKLRCLFIKQLKWNFKDSSSLQEADMELAQVTKNSSAATAVRKKKAAEPVATAAKAVATASENEVTGARPMAVNSHSDIQGNCKRILFYMYKRLSV
jgi:hypothetical protein